MLQAPRSSTPALPTPFRERHPVKTVGPDGDERLVVPDDEG